MLGALVAWAAPAAEDVLSQLRPPKPLVSPSFWQRRGAVLWAAALAVVVVAGLVVLWWRHRRAPKPRVSLPPDVQARRALAALRGRAEDEQLAAEISQILRRYLGQALALRAEAWTAAEWEAALRQHPQAGPGLADALARLLRDCDAVKFAPVRSAEPGELAARALDLINCLEQARHRALAAAAPQLGEPANCTPQSANARHHSAGLET